MKGIISFHPVDLGFFDGFAAPLINGDKIPLDAYLDEAVGARRRAWEARRFAHALESILEAARLPSLEPILARPASATELVGSVVELIRSPEKVLRGVKERLDRFDHRLDDLSRLVVEKVDPDLHLFGRPFLITAGSPGTVADVVDRYRRAASAKAVDNLALEQLIQLDSRLSQVEPEEDSPLSPDLAYRTEVFRELKALPCIREAGRPALEWQSPDAGIPWIAVRAHALVVPFWLARDVDGLETMCRAAGIPAPPFLSSPARLFREAGAEVQDVAGMLDRDLEGPRDLGAFVAPEHVPDLVSFLAAQGSQIIRVAARCGEAPAASGLLRKIRECAVYAEVRGLGYLEASGILPPDLSDHPGEA